MKINILTIALLILTALLDTGSPIIIYTVRDAIDALLFFKNSLDSGIKDEITGFLASDIGREFEKDLKDISNEHDSIQDRRAIIHLIYFAKYYTVKSNDQCSIADIDRRVKSQEMAKVMLKVIEDVKKNSIGESDMVTEFLNTARGKEFQEALTRYINDEAITSHNEECKRRGFTLMIGDITMMDLFFIRDNEGTYLFSKEDIPAVVRALQKAADPSASTQA
ncbi:hypothetical protein IWQ61_010076 [Dispira simplex]|nr:hypothetical protein IWQ61_010076 [Dispira simplex]